MLPPEHEGHLSHDKQTHRRWPPHLGGSLCYKLPAAVRAAPAVRICPKSLNSIKICNRAYLGLPRLPYHNKIQEDMFGSLASYPYLFFSNAASKARALGLKSRYLMEAQASPRRVPLQKSGDRLPSCSLPPVGRGLCN